MAIETPRDLFLHELSDAYSAEQQILKMLPTLASEVTDADLRTALKDHEKETREQIRNLDQVFKQLGETPEQMTCYGAEGLRKEHDSFVKEKPAENILTLFVAGAASKTEHYEIETYTGLVEMAKLLGETESAQLLQKNLDQEEAMAKKAEQFEKKLGKQYVTEFKRQERDAGTSKQSAS